MDIKHGSKTPHNQITVTRKPEMFMEKKTQNQEKNPKPGKKLPGVYSTNDLLIKNSSNIYHLQNPLS